MGFRGLLILVAVVLACVGCTSPGTNYGYLDVLIQPTATSSVAQPSTSQAFVITFPVRNTHDQALTVAYDIRQLALPTDLPTSGSSVQTGTLSIPAFGTVNATLSLPAKAAGSYTWSIVLDPTNLIAERNETNNTAVITVSVADFDVFFGSPAPTVTVPPTAMADLILDLAITNTNNVGAAAPTSASVNVAITIDGAGAVTVTSIMAGAPLATVTPPFVVGAGTTVPVRITVQRPAIGNHTYTIVLTPTVADSNVPNNTVIVSTPVAN